MLVFGGLYIEPIMKVFLFVFISMKMEEVGFVDMWLNFVGRGDFFMRDGLHLIGKGAAVLACEFVRVVNEGTGNINYLN